MDQNPRHTVAWQRLRRQIVAAARLANLPCAHCGGPIRYDLGGRHPYGPQVDHVVALALAPDQAIDASLVRVLHARCNLSLGGKLARARQRAARNGGVKKTERSPADDGAYTRAEVAAWRKYRAAGGTARTGWRW